MGRGSGAGPRVWVARGSGVDGWHAALEPGAHVVGRVAAARHGAWGPRVWMGGTWLYCIAGGRGFGWVARGSGAAGPCLDGCLELLGGWHAALELGGQLWPGGTPSLNGWHAALEQGRNQREGLSPCFARLRLCGIQALWVHFVKRNAKAMNPPSSPVSRVRLPYSVRVPYVG